MARDIISEQQHNINFVRAVEQHPCLYNNDLPTYYRRDITDKEWEKVGEAVNMTPSACRERWRNLRSVFIRNIKARKGCSKRKPYYLSDAMQFVAPYMRTIDGTDLEENPGQLTDEATRDSSDSDPILFKIDAIKSENCDVNSVESDEEVIVSPQPWKRLKDDDENVHQPKNMQTAQASSSNVIVENDAVKSFINSLMPELNEMNTAQFKSFKRRVLMLIDDITAEIPSDT